MSLFRQIIFLVLAIFLVSLAAKAQEIEAVVKILSAAPNARIRIEGKILDAEKAGKSWLFLQSYADAANLGARIENLKLYDARGAEIATKRLIAGEFETENAPASFRYEINAAATREITAAAHISWLAETHGLLMLNDLFPQNLAGLSAAITFEMPANWSVATSETQLRENIFSVRQIEKAIFLAGRDRREQTRQIDKTVLSFATVGEWQFTDAEAAQMAENILIEHQRTFGEIPVSKAQILLLPFPQNAAFERWRAETRGATVVILSAPTAFKANALNRLHEQLRHEIFHLWLPNALNLSGNYDWFYEGFTLYQSLKTGVRLNQIRFDDFLSTLGRAYDLTDALSRRRTVSLLEASEKRWLNANELIYAKGIVVAFLCDAAILRDSKGKRELDAVFREIYEKHRAPNQREDGSAAILRILKQNNGVISLAEKYIAGESKIEWQNDLNDFGLTADKTSGGTQLKVVAKPNGRQKDLLDKLGYNQWRKLLRRQ